MEYCYVYVILGSEDINKFNYFLQTRQILWIKNSQTHIKMCAVMI